MMKNKSFKKLEEFINILIKHERENPSELFPPPISAQFAFDCLVEALLGPDYYIVLPCNNEQGNTELLDAILKTYSRDYRRLVKKKQKELKQNDKET